MRRQFSRDATRSYLLVFVNTWRQLRTDGPTNNERHPRVNDLRCPPLPPPSHSYPLNSLTPPLSLSLEIFFPSLIFLSLFFCALSQRLLLSIFLRFHPFLFFPLSLPLSPTPNCITLLFLPLNKRHKCTQKCGHDINGMFTSATLPLQTQHSLSITHTHPLSHSLFLSLSLSLFLSHSSSSILQDEENSN